MRCLQVSICCFCLVSFCCTTCAISASGISTDVAHNRLTASDKPQGSPPDFQNLDQLRTYQRHLQDTLMKMQQAIALLRVRIAQLGLRLKKMQAAAGLYPDEQRDWESLDSAYTKLQAGVRLMIQEQKAIDMRMAESAHQLSQLQVAPPAS